MSNEDSRAEAIDRTSMIFNRLPTRRKNRLYKHFCGMDLEDVQVYGYADLLTGEPLPDTWRHYKIWINIGYRGKSLTIDRTLQQDLAPVNYRKMIAWGKYNIKLLDFSKDKLHPEAEASLVELLSLTT